MQDAIAAESLGSRINAAARLAAAQHLELDRQESLRRPQKAQAMIGGADRRVTDDPMSLSVVSGPSSVVEKKDN